MKTRYLLIGLIVVVCATVIVAVGRKSEPKPPVVSRPVKVNKIIVYKPDCKLPVDPKLIAANNEFGITLFKKMYAAGPDKNIFISPSSISLALSMTYNGADGGTRDAMAKVLGYQGMTLDQVNKANAALMANLAGPGKGVLINVANSLWARKGIDFESDFLARNRKCYSAEITNLDFRDSSAKSIINAWVSDRTEGKIDTIVNRIDPQAVLYLVNTVYFRGEWTLPFEPKETVDGVFTVPGGEKKTVHMMKQDGYMTRLYGDTFDAVSLPYGEGRYSLYLFLPNRESSIGAFVKSLNPKKWHKWVSEFSEDYCDLSLPRFTLEYESRETLKSVLSALGMSSAFDPEEANFQKMCKDRPWIEEVAHKTFLDVDEQGTEAAAATSIGVAMGCPPARSVSLTFDRPFFLAIRDNRTGVVLFMGAVLYPQEG